MKRTSLDRAEYIQRAHEFAPKGADAAKKLTTEQVEEIRRNRNGLSYKALGELYGVHRNTIYRIANKITWSLT